MKRKKSNISIMGIVNITPDSFSDGGKFNSLESFKNHINKLVESECDIFDIGAESTAPFNDPIDREEEYRRFKKILIPNLHLFPKNATLSIDTYKSVLFRKLYDEISEAREDLNLIWNDVSGCLDDELFIVLKKCPRARYIFCHTLNRERELSSHHMDRAVDENNDITSTVFDRFSYAKAIFKERGVLDRVIFDPCFGFSKTFEQNWTLIRELPKLLKQFPTDIEWLIGISKKSFLKKLARAPSELEELHISTLGEIIEGLDNRKLIFRVHDPEVVKQLS